MQRLYCACIFMPLLDISICLSSDSLLSFPSKVCFVKFANIESCQTALHLTNSILLDRALIVVNSKYSKPLYIYIYIYAPVSVYCAGYGIYY